MAVVALSRPALAWPGAHVHTHTQMVETHRAVPSSSSTFFLCVCVCMCVHHEACSFRLYRRWALILYCRWVQSVSSAALWSMSVNSVITTCCAKFGWNICQCVPPLLPFHSSILSSSSKNICASRHALCLCEREQILLYKISKECHRNKIWFIFIWLFFKTLKDKWLFFVSALKHQVFPVWNDVCVAQVKDYRSTNLLKNLM